MNTPQEREQTLALFSEAVTAGARRKPVAAILNVALRTLQRWLPKGSTTILLDQRPLAPRPTPSNRLTAEEYAKVIEIVNWAEYAAALMQQAVLREKTQLNIDPLVLHSDNGSAMKSKTLSVKLADLGVVKSHSRPRVSDDNAYIESFFRTLKYCPQFPRKGFDSIDAARVWTKDFMQWYNFEHQHSKISFVTPAQRHTGEDIAVLEQRKVVYTAAKANHPTRWSGKTRCWEYISSVALNPEAEALVKMDKAA